MEGRTPGKNDRSSSSTHSIKTESELKESEDEAATDESPQSRPNNNSNWNQSVYSGTEIQSK